MSGKSGGYVYWWRKGRLCWRRSKYFVIFWLHLPKTLLVIPASGIFLGSGWVFFE